MELKNYPVAVIAVYSPTDDAVAVEKDRFFNDLIRLLDSVSNRKEIFVIGDLMGRAADGLGLN